LEPVVSTDVMK